MTTIDIDTLLESETADALFAIGLELASALGLPVTAWQTGGPSRAFFKFIASGLARRDDVITSSIKAGFLSKATGTWLTVLAEEVYGVTREAATAATPSVSFTNSGGGVYSKAIGEVIVKSSASGETYRNTEALTLAASPGPGNTATIAFEADTAGSDGTVIADELDEIVSTMLGVSITSSTAATGIDEQSDSSLRTECQDTLGALSSNGPPDAYNSVVKNSTLTGSSTITRATTTENAADGTVTVYVASATGAVSAGVVTAAQTAVETWATPACITPTLASATDDAQTFAMNVDGDGIPGTAEADITALIGTYLSTLDIGGLLAISAITGIAHDYLVDAGVTSPTVSVTSPAADVQLSTGYVATINSVTVTEV